MPYERLPSLSFRDATRAFRKLGFEVVRQRGSHAILENAETGEHAVIPAHRTVDRFTLGSALEQAKLTVEEFLRALRD